MVRREKDSVKMHTTYYLKPGQTLKNTKASERALALVINKRAFQQFVDHVTEDERNAEIAKREAEKLQEFKKATYEMSKTWDNTIENIQRRRKDELLTKRKREEAERMQFAKKMAAKKAAERTEIVKEAKKLLLYRKPQCRAINQALLASECFRELEAQIAFKKTLEGIDRERDKEYVNLMRKDVENYKEEEKKKAEEVLKKNRTHGIQLKRQIEILGSDLKRMEAAEYEAQKRDLKIMENELNLIKQCEADEADKKKKMTNQMLLEAIEQKKAYESEDKRAEEFQTKALEVYLRSKKRIQQMHKSLMKEEQEERIRRAENIVKKLAERMKTAQASEEEKIQKVAEEKEALERQKLEEQKRYDEKLRAELLEFRKQAERERRKREQEEKQLKDWETLQRYKRDEYNKRVQQEEKKRQWDKKMQTARTFQQQVMEKEAERRHEEMLNDDSAVIKKMIQSTNDRVLAYGQEVIEESRGVRPLFPILKVIEGFKKEIGMLPMKQHVELASEAQPKLRRSRKPQTICSNPIPEHQIHYL
ncbi:trichohyalin [Orussus abietinus]|uniref:trichohyalin n=1 Tax=Orussus abietinus TaxID=222816 RepID=UPI000625C012|nr:trichohyalin [Orussus abietinus]